MRSADIIIGEEHPIVREGIKSIIRTLGTFSDILECSSAEALLKTLQRSSESIFVLNQSIYREARQIWRNPSEGKKPRVLVVVEDAVRFQVRDLVKGFADGWILKTANLDEWKFAFRRVTSGKNYVSGEIVWKIAERLSSDEYLNPEPPAGITLSEREKQVLQLVAEGYTNEQIAERIYASKRTVEAHRMRLIGKANCRNTATLIKYAVKAGLVK